MMTRLPLYIAPVALVGLMATQAQATSAVWGGSMVRNIATATAGRTDASLVLARFRGGGGGGLNRGSFSGGGVHHGSFNRGNFGQRPVAGQLPAGGYHRGNYNFNRNVNISGGGYYGGGWRGGYYGPGWGGVAAGVATGAALGAAAASTASCPYPNYPNCGLY